MEYFVAFQILCGCFSAFVAGRKGRSRIFWWFVGALVPLFGVLLSLIVAEAAPGPTGIRAGEPGAARPPQPRRRPKRCRQSYIPDCHGCPHFRRQLFSTDEDETRKGYCELFGIELCDESKAAGHPTRVEDN